MKRLTSVLAVTALAVAAWACNAPGIGQPTSPPPAATSAPTVEAPAPTEVPAATAVPGVLPAPLVYIDNASQQIWRMEPDGVTTQQITSEAQPVTDFAVSPTDGSLAYVTGNDLIHTDSMGGGRTVLVTGPALDGSDASHVMQTVNSPSWSPDGTKLAYGLGGVNILDLSSGASTLVIPNDPYPAPGANVTGSQVRFYRPGVWSPDGARMVVDFSYYPEAGGEMILDLASGATVQLTNPDNSIVCCTMAWSSDSQSVYWSSAQIGMISPGLWRADAATGTGVTLVQGFTSDNMLHMVGFAHPLADGSLLYFYADANGNDAGSNVLITMARSDADGVTNRQMLRSNSYLIPQALWAPDATGAVIFNNASGQDWVSGPLLWLPADGSPALPLNITATTSFHWGQ